MCRWKRSIFGEDMDKDLRLNLLAHPVVVCASDRTLLGCYQRKRSLIACTYSGSLWTNRVAINYVYSAAVISLRHHEYRTSDGTRRWRHVLQVRDGGRTRLIPAAATAAAYGVMWLDVWRLRWRFDVGSMISCWNVRKTSSDSYMVRTPKAEICWKQRTVWMIDTSMWHLLDRSIKSEWASLLSAVLHQRPFHQLHVASTSTKYTEKLYY